MQIESLILCQNKNTTHSGGVFILLERRFEPIAEQHPSGVLLPPVQKLVATFIFAFGENANRIPHPLPK
jgi:hypothetical protein